MKCKVLQVVLVSCSRWIQPIYRCLCTQPMDGRNPCPSPCGPTHTVVSVPNPWMDPTHVHLRVVQPIPLSLYPTHGWTQPMSIPMWSNPYRGLCTQPMDRPNSYPSPCGPTHTVVSEPNPWMDPTHVHLRVVQPIPLSLYPTHGWKQPMSNSVWSYSLTSPVS